MGRWSALALAAGLSLAGCGEPQPSGLRAATEAARAKPAPEAVEHPDVRFLVDYGGTPYRVNVRYVALIDESVIAVRQGGDVSQEDGPEWQRLDLPAEVEAPSSGPFAQRAYRDVVIDIARGVQARGGVCAEGQAIDMSTNGEGDVRTTYRRNREVWVVFALCPEQVAEETG